MFPKVYFLYCSWFCAQNRANFSHYNFISFFLFFDKITPIDTKRINVKHHLPQTPQRKTHYHISTSDPTFNQVDIITTPTSIWNLSSFPEFYHKTKTCFHLFPNCFLLNVLDRNCLVVPSATLTNLTFGHSKDTQLKTIIWKKLY